MRAIRYLVTTLAFVSSVRGVSADDTITQMGEFQCHQLQLTETGFPYACDFVPFKLPFGDTPNLILMGCGDFWTNPPFPTGSFGPSPSPVRENKCIIMGPGFSGTTVSPSGFTPKVVSNAPNVTYPPAGGATGTFEGKWIATGHVLYKGSATAKYMILAVVYAPPGANGGHASSSVSYSTSSLLGTTTSSSSDFKTSSGISLDLKGGFL